MVKGVFSRGLLTFFVTLILTIVLVAIANVGLSLFVEFPEYPDCRYPSQFDDGGKPVSVSVEEQAVFDECQEGYEESVRAYNQVRFYVFSGLGVLLVLAGLVSFGLFESFGFVTWTGLLTGLIFLGEGVVMNWANKLAVFITLIVVLLLVGFGAYMLYKRLK